MSIKPRKSPGGGSPEKGRQMPKGRPFPKGASPNPGGRTKEQVAEAKAFREAMAALVAPSVQHLADVLDGAPREFVETVDGVEMKVMRLTATVTEMTAAAREVFDRVFGKAVQAVEATVTVDAAEMTDAALAAIVATAKPDAATRH